MQPLPVFDSWDCVSQPLPPRSQLYALEPIGIGTAIVESLSGYVARLADAHSLSVGDIVGRFLSRSQNPYGAIIAQSWKRQRAEGHGFHACGYAINGASEKAMQALKRRSDLESKFWAALEETPVPTVNALCRRLDITRWFIDQYFPDARNALAARHRQFASAETTRRREKLFQDVRDIAATLQRQGLYPSTNRIIDHLPPGSSREWVALNLAVDDAHKALGISR